MATVLGVYRRSRDRRASNAELRGANAGVGEVVVVVSLLVSTLVMLIVFVLVKFVMREVTRALPEQAAWDEASRYPR